MPKTIIVFSDLGNAREKVPESHAHPPENDVPTQISDDRASNDATFDDLNTDHKVSARSEW
jgi:hypothetical protein